MRARARWSGPTNCAGDWDLAANEMSWNQGFRLLFGHEREDSSRDIWRSLLHPDDVARVERGVVAFLGSPAEF